MRSSNIDELGLDVWRHTYDKRRWLLVSYRPPRRGSLDPASSLHTPRRRAVTTWRGANELRPLVARAV